MDWLGLKGFAAELGLEKDALHIYVAVIIQLFAAFLFRKSLSHWLPWLCVLLAALLNEFLDIWFGEELKLEPWQIAGAKHDLFNTMVMPTVLLLLCRYAPAIFEPRKTEPEGPEAPDSSAELDPLPASAAEAGDALRPPTTLPNDLIQPETR